MEKILHLEDNESYAWLVHSYFKRLAPNTQFIHFENPEEAYEAVFQEEWDAIIVDWDLKNQFDGADFIEAVRNIRQDLLIVGNSGTCNDLLLEAGADVAFDKSDLGGMWDYFGQKLLSKLGK